MIQFNYPSGGIGKKERKRYAFTDFRGVDTSLAGINVDPSHAVESTNFVDRNGVLHKRYGWEQVYQFDDEINGFWDLALDSVNFKICYAGNKFYRLLSTGWGKVYEADNLVSRYTACYVQNNKAYFVGCGDLLVFRLDNESGEYKFFRVVDDEETYIPTTTARILPEHLVEQGLKGRYVRDSVNTLTGWRKNTLVGAAVEGESISYNLDATPKISESAKAYMYFDSDKYEFVYNKKLIIEPEEGVNVFYSIININPCYPFSLNEGKYPEILYDSISEDGEYDKNWLLRIDGKNGSAGLRWKREAQEKLIAKKENTRVSYRVYTLYFVSDVQSNKEEIPVVRRFYRNAYGEEVDYTGDIDVDIVWNNNREGTIICSKTNADQYAEEIAIDVSITYKYIKNQNTLTTAYGTYTTRIVIYPNSESNQRNIYLRVAPVENAEKIISFTKKKVISSKIEEVDYKEVEETHIINLSKLEERYIQSYDYVSGEKAIIAQISNWEEIESVISFKKAILSCTQNGISAEIDLMGALTITEWAIASTSNTANVEVKFYVESPPPDFITSCKYSTLYGVDGEADRLFIANADDSKKRNIIYFSEMDDFTYFPDVYTKAVGGNASEVKGFIRLSNGSMAALKNIVGKEPTVFVFKGEYMSGFYDAEQEEPYVLPKFSTSGVSTTQGIIAPYASANLADDSMFLSQNGVYALELSQGTDSQRFAKERSLPINNLLKECNISDLENANAITYENKYYLAVKHYKKTKDEYIDESKQYYEIINGIYQKAINPDADKGMQGYYEKEDCVYVADAHYTFKPSGAMADASSYEWYPLTDIPVRSWFTIGQDLYFGTDDGKICRFAREQYYDITKQYFAQSGTNEANKYSQQGVKVISSIQDSDDKDSKPDVFVLSQYTDIEDGDTITFFSGTLVGIVYDETVNLLNRELYIKKIYNDEGKFNGSLQLKYSQDGEVIQFISAQKLCATIQRKTPVKARRVLPTFDFGMPDYLKTLESFTIAMSGVEGGNLVFTIRTRNNEGRKRVIAEEMQGQNAFGYLNGFGNWAYNVTFQNSFTHRVSIRNFNYCIFEMANDLPVDCSVSSISVTYKYNQVSRGVQ